MPIPKLIKIEDLEEFANLVSGKYFYILKKYSDNEYLIQIEEDKSTQYDFVISDSDEGKVLFRIVGNINSNKKYKASLITDPYLGADMFLLIYEPEYFIKEFKDNEIKNSIELQEENKKIEELFNQLRSVLAGVITETQMVQLQEKSQSIIEIEKEQDKETDLDQFYNIVEEVYKEADIEKRYKRIKLLEKEEEVEEKEEEYGLKDEGDDDE